MLLKHIWLTAAKIFRLSCTWTVAFGCACGACPAAEAFLSCAAAACTGFADAAWVLPDFCSCAPRPGDGMSHKHEKDATHPVGHNTPNELDAYNHLARYKQMTGTMEMFHTLDNLHFEVSNTSDKLQQAALCCIQLSLQLPKAAGGSSAATCFRKASASGEF